MMLQIKLLSIFMIFSITFEQCSQQDPGCIKCHYQGDDDKFICDEYLCNTYACGKCATDNTCEECVAGFQIQNKTCIACEPGCETCNFQSSGKLICGECYIGYYMTINHTCEYCSNIMYYCSNCTYPNGQNFQCFDCGYDYGLNTEQKCQQCIANCDSCGVQNGQFTCLECWYGYAVNGNNECQACPTGATDCYWDENSKQMIPISCDIDSSNVNNYYLNSDTKECLLCPKNCLNCEYNHNLQKAICTTCSFANQDQGFINLQGRCQSLLSVTSNCASAKYIDDVIQCEACSDRFEIDIQTHTCQKINCNQITENCALCSYRDIYNGSIVYHQKYCEQCDPQSYFDITQEFCLKCDVDNCNKCINKTFCQQCQYGYYLTADQQQCLSLTDVIPHCLFGHVNQGENYPVCDECIGYGEQGFYQQGYYVNTNQTECEQCPFEGCAFCMQEYGPLFCDECRAGYFQIENTFTCKQIPIQHCAMSTAYGPGNEQQCIQCMPGYYGVDGYCKKIKSSPIQKLLSNFK